MYLGVRQILFLRDTCKGMYLLCGDDSFCVDQNAVEILELCDGTRSEGELIDLLSARYPDDPDLVADVTEFITMMESDNVIVRWPEPKPLAPVYRNDHPIGATIEITYRCNLRCSFCIADATYTNGCDTTNDNLPEELSWAELEPVIAELAGFGPAPINITGGEPLLRPDLVFQIAKKARVSGLDPLLITNGTLVDDTLARELYQAGIREVQVSIDSPEAEVHDTGRGVPGAFIQALQGIDSLRKAKIDVSGAAVITRRSIGQIHEISRIFQDYGAHNKISEVSPLGRGLGHPDLLTAEDIFRLRVFQAETVGGQLAVELIPRERCSIGAIPALNPYGDVFPCFSMRFPVFRLGNIRQNSLKEIWKTSQVLQELFNWKIDDIDGCRDCKNRLVCGGGCRAIAYACHHTIYKPDPYHCKASRLFTEELLQRAEPGTRADLLNLLDLSANHDDGFKMGKGA